MNCNENLLSCGWFELFHADEHTDRHDEDNSRFFAVVLNVHKNCHTACQQLKQTFPDLQLGTSPPNVLREKISVFVQIQYLLESDRNLAW